MKNFIRLKFYMYLEVWNFIYLPWKINGKFSIIDTGIRILNILKINIPFNLLEELYLWSRYFSKYKIKYSSNKFLLLEYKKSWHNVRLYVRLICYDPKQFPVENNKHKLTTRYLCERKKPNLIVRNLIHTKTKYM